MGLQHSRVGLTLCGKKKKKKKKKKEKEEEEEEVYFCITPTDTKAAGHTLPTPANQLRSVNH
jgi:hypothetical protein